MATQINLGNLTVDVTFKDIKNIHLSVYPPDGKVRISAPARMNLDTVRVFAISKLGWIKQQQEKLLRQDRETPREYLDRESHYVWGKRYLLQIVEGNAPPGIELKHNTLVLRVRPGTEEQKKQAIVEVWYREQLKVAAADIITRWEPRIGVKVGTFFVQRMKTKWGNCNPIHRSLRFNTELAKKPPECLEYIVVHEMVHLLEPTHNARFVALMERFMPNWRMFREQLNQLPVRHEAWDY
ncbi:SprT family zinc-dependent metalloprotease [Methylomicrobium sp. Wu6]|uniref:M48 family metallopeptidase n=1 Tax=Methylomicrobium sp. Wu6 TaxID=3107928 RepID=UPI002DD6527C|nr:SprT family zinc-dependent metalloprotease [Methylomicrobium sp. Wu6]MEC4747169.1 SprT family zinc-dependent metalloprotease [Methylomicrobium sp. Wu6]